MEWTVELLNNEVTRELESLPKDIGASFIRISALISAFGLPKIS